MTRILCGIAVVCMTWVMAIATGEAATVTVIRGDQVENVTTARKSSLPHVLRGVVAAANPETMPVNDQVQGVQILQARGNALWLRDGDSGEIIACTIWGSGMVGRDTFRCTGSGH